MDVIGWMIASFIAFLVLWFFWRRRKIPATQCGHLTMIRGSFTAFGETFSGRVPVVRGRTMYCHACLGKMSIRCAWCGRPIVPGHEVTLYLEQPGVKMPSYAVSYTHEDTGQRAYVGCLHCAEGGFGDAQGVWLPPGRVERVPSPLEIAVAAIRQGATMVIAKRG